MSKESKVVFSDIMLVLHCFAAILMEVKNGGEDKGLRLKIEEENQEKRSLETAQRQNCTAGQSNARSLHQGSDASRFCYKRQTVGRWTPNARR